MHQRTLSISILRSRARAGGRGLAVSICPDPLPSRQRNARNCGSLRLTHRAGGPGAPRPQRAQVALIAAVGGRDADAVDAAVDELEVRLQYDPARQPVDDQDEPRQLEPPGLAG